MAADRTWSKEDGFSLVELLTAAVVLLVGILGVLGLFTSALQTTAANNERVGATNLARELVEAARGIPYEDLNDVDIEASIQSLPNMGSGDPWTVVRRNVTYEITASACVYDDPTDGTEAGRTVCPGTPTSTQNDRSGDDFRRATFRISWRDHNGGAGTMTQTTMIVNPSGGLGPRIISITSDTPLITDPNTTRATFTVTTSFAHLLNWAADDGRSSGQYVGPGKTWQIVWELGAVGATPSVVDGTYRINAQATDNHGIAGDTKVATVQINRNAPFALKAQGGYNERLDVVEVMWDPTTERDVVGYRVYYAGPNKVPGGGDDARVCPTGTGWLPVRQLSCTYPKTLPGEETYFVVALDNGGSREGTPSNTIKATPGGTPLSPPASLTGSLQDGSPRLDWTAPASGTVRLYRIYRGGTGVQHRIGFVSGSTFSYVDSSPGNGGDYYVTAVDSTFNESAPKGPVTVTVP